MATADEPLRRCNLYLYESDVEWLYRRFGYGWSIEVRRAVRNLRRETEPMAPVRIGDIDDAAQ